MGAGRASPSGLGSPSLPAPLALISGASAAPGNPRSELGPTPAFELSSSLSRLGSGQPQEEPLWVWEQVPHGAGMSPGVQVWARRRSGALERCGGRREAGFSASFDRCQRRKRFPLLIAGALTAKRAFVCLEEK